MKDDHAQGGSTPTRGMLGPDGFTMGVGGARPQAGRVLALTGIAHALHDGYTDLIYVLLPVWQAEFALGYGMLAVLRGLYAGAMAALQLPAGILAERFGARGVLVAGTALAAIGYAIAGLSGGLVGLCTGLVLSGAGSSTQHPIASTAIARAFGSDARGPLGTYNFTGDLGKAAFPPLTALLLAAMSWRTSLGLLAVIGLVVAAVLALLMPPIDFKAAEEPPGSGTRRSQRLPDFVRDGGAGQRGAHGVPDLPPVRSRPRARRCRSSVWRSPRCSSVGRQASSAADRSAASSGWSAQSFSPKSVRRC